MTVPPNAVRLVPKVPGPYDETESLIERHGWVESDDFSDDLYEWIVPGAQERTVVRWVDDGDTGVQFFVVEGPDRQRVAEQIEEAVEMLHVPDFEQYLAGFHGVQGLMRGLYAVAAAAPERYDPRVAELFQRYLAAEDPLIRRVASLATGIMGWNEFIEPVSRLRTDPDPDVRQAAEAALRGLGASGLA